MGERIFSYIVDSLLAAWFLSLFGFNWLFINAIKDIFNWNITDGVYYLTFLIGGLIVFAIEERKRDFLLNNKKENEEE